MGNIPNQTVICKCQDLLPLSDEAFPIFNRRRRFKLMKAIKLLIDAQLNQRADLDEISSFQVVRTLQFLPLEVLQSVWLMLTERLQHLYSEKGVSGLGKLHLIDSTALSP